MTDSKWMAESGGGQYPTPEETFRALGETRPAPTMVDDLFILLNRIQGHANSTFNVASCGKGDPTISAMVDEFRRTWGI